MYLIILRTLHVACTCFNSLYYYFLFISLRLFPIMNFIMVIFKIIYNMIKLYGTIYLHNIKWVNSMMKIKGKATLYFDSSKISTSTVNYIFAQSFYRYTTTSHLIANPINIINLNFEMLMKKNVYPPLNEYYKDIARSFRSKFPSVIIVEPLTIESISKVSKEELNSYSSFSVNYIDKQLDNS